MTPVPYNQETFGWHARRWMEDEVLRLATAGMDLVEPGVWGGWGELSTSVAATPAHTMRSRWVPTRTPVQLRRAPGGVWVSSSPFPRARTPYRSRREQEVIRSLTVWTKLEGGDMTWAFPLAVPLVVAAGTGTQVMARVSFGSEVGGVAGDYLTER